MKYDISSFMYYLITSADVIMRHRTRRFHSSWKRVNNIWDENFKQLIAIFGEQQQWISMV